MGERKLIKGKLKNGGGIGGWRVVQLHVYSVSGTQTGWG